MSIDRESIIPDFGSYEEDILGSVDRTSEPGLGDYIEEHLPYVDGLISEVGVDLESEPPARKPSSSDGIFDY